MAAASRVVNSPFLNLSRSVSTACDLVHSADLTNPQRRLFVLHLFSDRLHSYRGAKGARSPGGAPGAPQFEKAGLDQPAFASDKISEHRCDTLEKFGPTRDQTKHLSITKTVLCEVDQR